MELQKTRAERLRPDLHRDAFHGLGGDVARTLAARTGADPASILTMFLTMFGNSIGRQPHVSFYGHEEPARLDVLVVGKWARGRKGTAYNAVRKLIAPAEPEWANTRIESGIQSAEAMIELVADSPTGDPRLLILETEFARFANTMGVSKKFSSQMRTAYDGEPLSRKRVGQAPMMSTQHHISLVGMITPGELIQLQKLTGGLESRFLYVMSAPARQTDADPFAEVDDEIYLSERIKSAINVAWDNILEGAGPISAELARLRGVAPNCKFMIADDVSDNWLEAIAPEIEGLADDLGEDFERYTARGQTHVIRLALIYALLDEAKEIDWPHIKAAMALWEFCARSARLIFSVPDNPDPRINPRDQGKVYDYLLDHAKDWVPMVELTTTALSKNASASVIVADLEDLGLVETRKRQPKGGRGRPVVEVRIATT